MSSDNTQTQTGGNASGIENQVGQARETLSQPESKENLVDVVGMFALSGLGAGLIGTLGAGQIPLIGKLFSAFATLAVALSGPVLAVVLGARLADGMGSGRYARLLTSAVGNSVGYIVMTILAAFVSGAAGVEGIGLGDLVFASVIFGIIVGLVGAGSTYLSMRS